MTHTQMVRQELCRAKCGCPQCENALVSAMLLFGGEGDPLYRSDFVPELELLAECIVSQTGVMTHIEEEEGGKRKRKYYRLTLEPTEDVSYFYETFQLALHHQLDPSLVQKSCCAVSFLRGMFLACGVLVNPQKEYHLEFKCRLEDPVAEAEVLLRRLHQPFRRTRRSGFEVLYLKDSDSIADFLTLLGAVQNSMDLVQTKIYKELRNNANRVTNCETANIDKTVQAAARQIQDIELVLEKKGKAALSEDLLQVAEVRIKHPEESLSELCRILGSGISRSGLNHRLKKFAQMAETIRAEQKHEPPENRVS